jgi:hypothetical protein
MIIFSAFLGWKKIHFANFGLPEPFRIHMGVSSNWGNFPHMNTQTL